MDEWKEYRIEDVCSRITSGSTPSRKRLDYFGGTIPWLSSKEVNFNRIERTDEHITEAGLRNSSAKWIEPNAVIVAMYGATAGRVALSRIRLTTNQACCNLTTDQSKCDYEYLFYFLTSKYEELVQLSTGVAQQNLSLAVLKEFPLLLPSVGVQRSTASLLSSLDAKIDLLNRQNKTLEAMAETLFRQWFVEEAEEDGAEGTLVDVAVNIRDGVPVNAFNADDRYVALEHIDRRCIALQQFGNSADVASNKYRFGVNDILFGKLRPYFHKVCLTSFAGICSTDILVIRPKRPELLYYCLFAFFQDEVVEYANAGSGGTRMPRTSWSDLSKYPIALPGKEKLEAFNKVVKPMMDKLQTNIPQIRSITALRDTLLPKLMSGEVRVEMN